MKSSTNLNSSKLTDIYNIIIVLDTREDILSVMNPERFSYFNLSFTIALHAAPPMLLSVVTKKNLFKNTIFKKYQRSFRLPVNRHLFFFESKLFFFEYFM